MSMKKRVFFAINLSNPIKETLKIFFDQVKTIENIRWEPIEKLHVTLLFLGYVEEKQIESLRIIIKDTAQQVVPFTLSLVPKLSAFPSLSAPRILWLPVISDGNQLEKIKMLLEGQLEKYHIPFDKKQVTMHVTLGRVKRFEKENIGQIQQILEETMAVSSWSPKKPLSFVASGKTLFESTLSPRGSKYTVIQYEDFRH